MHGRAAVDATACSRTAVIHFSGTILGVATTVPSAPPLQVNILAVSERSHVRQREACGAVDGARHDASNAAVLTEFAAARGLLINRGVIHICHGAADAADGRAGDVRGQRTADSEATRGGAQVARVCRGCVN